MSKRDPNKIYENQIEPLLQKLMRRCKHYDLPVLVAVSMPLTEATGATMVQMQADANGSIPTEFLGAFRQLEAPKQEAVADQAPAAA